MEVVELRVIGELGSCVIGGDAEECGMWWKYRVWNVVEVS